MTPFLRNHSEVDITFWTTPSLQAVLSSFIQSIYTIQVMIYNINVIVHEGDLDLHLNKHTRKGTLSSQ